uniref:Uncharacterized protein n=1 Tax=Arundo donax TaxID=35708 RepID=A0A0A9GFG7_ARUDO
MGGESNRSLSLLHESQNKINSSKDVFLEKCL